MSQAPLVLVHGAWHSASCWDLLIPCLEKLGHQVLSPDLPGHGENAAEMDRITLNCYTSFLSQVVDKYKNKVTVVGHSMSGMVISQVAENIPHKIERLVYLSAYLPRDGQSLFDLINVNGIEGEPAPIEKALVMSADKRSCTIAPDDIEPLFYNCCEGELRDYIPRSLPAQATLPLSGKVRLSDEHFGQIPKTYICCKEDRVIPITHQRQMIRQQPCTEMIQLDCDHSPFLSCPAVLASVLHSISLSA